jgi:hypothetical protein
LFEFYPISNSLALLTAMDQSSHKIHGGGGGGALLPLTAALVLADHPVVDPGGDEKDLCHPSPAAAQPPYGESARGHLCPVLPPGTSSSFLPAASPSVDLVVMPLTSSSIALLVVLLLVVILFAYTAMMRKCYYLNPFF